MSNKYFITANELLLDSYRLARKVLDSEFQPNFLVGVWRGGTPIGIAVQEYLSYHGVDNDHIAIRTSGYDDKGKPLEKIKVFGLDYIVSKANAEDRLLLVDDVFDRGLTIKAIIDELERKMRKNLPTIKIATGYYKSTKNLTTMTPDFYIHETDKWIVFPHELNDLTPEEIREGKGEEIFELLKRE